MKLRDLFENDQFAGLSELQKKHAIAELTRFVVDMESIFGARDDEEETEGAEDDWLKSQMAADEYNDSIDEHIENITGDLDSEWKKAVAYAGDYRYQDYIPDIIKIVKHHIKK